MADTLNGKEQTIRKNGSLTTVTITRSNYLSVECYVEDQLIRLRSFKTALGASRHADKFLGIRS